MHPAIKAVIKQNLAAAQKTAIACLEAQVHAPCLLEAVNFFHGYKTAQSSANLIQALRDYFGAHTFQKTNDTTEKNYHAEWEKL